MNESKLMRQGLSSFLNGLVGEKILVELRGDKYINGILESCDCYINLRMRDVTMLEGAEVVALNKFFISGRHVRFIHMNAYADVVASVRKGLRINK
ncbi:hypothetical protein PFISCL1PPCAC_19890 [Pristionchus fissidentatus]|uniref:Sm domain-containing protein n=1 Tax=Pristionchus fissidentatus TaxID=1538716 RepID=A0AAV5WAN6_9BILA|nr:hypothetical protein PFISCL1PPCAC_19890 [Pristionchus fissidentatus]